MDVKHFKIYIYRNELPNGVLKILNNIDLDWKEDIIRFKTFTDGITNTLIGCYCEIDPKEIVLVRVYGDKTDLYIDRTAEVRNFKLMNSNGYAPKLFATFENGMVYGYVHGEVLNIHTCRDVSVYPLVASMLAKMHKLHYEENFQKVPIVWNKCERFIELIPDTYSDPDKQQRFNKNFPNGKNVFQNELTQIKRQLENIINPIVFCHNDLLLANVIYCGNTVSFIDYEYAGYNYQAFDIANHFIEFAGVTEFDCSLYPSKEFQLEWIRIYLKEFVEDSILLDEELILKLYSDVCKFMPVSHLFWTLWSLVQSHHSYIEFDYIKYAAVRYHEYRKSLKCICST